MAPPRSLGFTVALTLLGTAACAVLLGNFIVHMFTVATGGS